MKGKVLVATQAFGLGINIKWLRWVFHVGCPPNIALWVQELGRAGRDEKSPNAVILVKEHADMQRLKFWIKELDDEAMKQKREEYSGLMKYVYGAFVGYCLHEWQMRYFGEHVNNSQSAKVGTC